MGFDASQPRASDGKWSKSGGGGKKKGSKKNAPGALAARNKRRVEKGVVKLLTKKSGGFRPQLKAAAKAPKVKGRLSGKPPKKIQKAAAKAFSAKTRRR